MRAPVLLALFPILLCHAESRTLTLRQAIDLALQQNPDLIIARLDQQKMRDQVTVTKDPFLPHVFAGSGAAYTNGFPTSIDGNAPSILEMKTSMSLFDRPLSYQVAAAREAARGAGFDITTKQDEVVYRVASLFLDAEHASQSLTAAQQEVANLSRVKDLTQTRVQEGRELSHASRQANNEVLHAQARIRTLDDSAATSERSLALVLGLSPGDRVHPAGEQRAAIAVPESQDAAIAAALDRSPEVKRLESSLQSKTLEIKGYKAQWLPKADLVAQYNVLGKYNNYDLYFSRFQRNNVELGASFSIPLIRGKAASAQASQAQADIMKLRTQIGSIRSRVTADLQQAFDTVKRAEGERDLARDDLELAREQTSIDLALLDEGRIQQSVIEKDRAEEQAKWLAYYDTQLQSERAKLDVLRLTGAIMEALK